MGGCGCCSGLGQHFYIIKREVFPLIRQPVVRPRFDYDINDLTETIITLRHRDIEGFELFGVEAAPRAPVHASFGQNIKQGEFLS